MIKVVGNISRSVNHEVIARPVIFNCGLFDLRFCVRERLFCGGLSVRVTSNPPKTEHAGSHQNDCGKCKKTKLAEKFFRISPVQFVKLGVYGLTNLL